MESSELRNQRLKEVFQRKIQEFRTVCYILTGYQIDITTESQYRLTSVYAEHMEDSLLFKKVGDQDLITSLSFSHGKNSQNVQQCCNAMLIDTKFNFNFLFCARH